MQSDLAPVSLALKRFTRAHTGLYGVFCDRFDVPMFCAVENFDRRIPAGVYRIGFETSARFGPECLTVFAVPGRTGIRIHKANHPHELKGCISPGMSWFTRKSPGVSQSAVALERLHRFVRGLSERERFMRIIDYDGVDT